MYLKCGTGNEPEAQLIAVGPASSIANPFLDYFSSYGVDSAADNAAPDAATKAVTAHGSASSSGTVVASTFVNGISTSTSTTIANGTVLFRSGNLVIVIGGGPSVSGAQTYSVNFELTASSGTPGSCSAVTQVTPSG